jgi:hypothetical protein
MAGRVQGSLVGLPRIGVSVVTGNMVGTVQILVAFVP